MLDWGLESLTRISHHQERSSMSNYQLQCRLGLAVLALGTLEFYLATSGSFQAGFLAGVFLIPLAILLSFMFSIAVGLRKPPSENNE